MTLVEYLAPLKKGKQIDQVLAALYFRQVHENGAPMSAGEIRAALKLARVNRHAKINVSDVLARCGHFVNVAGKQGTKSLWRITDSGTKHVVALLGAPTASTDVQQDVSTLRQVLSKLADEDVRDYVDESIKCLEVGARRAAVVFLWTGAIRVVEGKALEKGKKAVNAALTKHDPKARSVSTLDHFSYIKDKITLLAATDLGVLDKSEKDTLQEGLDLRNRCGHPAKYKPGEKKVSSFIEDVVQIVFS